MTDGKTKQLACVLTAESLQMLTVTLPKDASGPLSPVIHVAQGRVMTLAERKDQCESMLQSLKSLVIVQRI